jgi:hypothetical protein
MALIYPINICTSNHPDQIFGHPFSSACWISGSATSLSVRLGTRAVPEDKLSPLAMITQHPVVFVGKLRVLSSQDEKVRSKGKVAFLLKLKTSSGFYIVGYRGEIPKVSNDCCGISRYSFKQR